MKTLVKIFLLGCMTAILALGAFRSHQKKEQNLANEVLIENIEVLTVNEDSQTPNSSWYQYLEYTHPCGGSSKMKLYCSKTKSSSHCTYHCGKKIY